MKTWARKIGNSIIRPNCPHDWILVGVAIMLILMWYLILTGPCKNC